MHERRLLQAQDIDVTDNPDVVSPPSPSDDASPSPGVSALGPEDQPPPSQGSASASGDSSAQGNTSAGVLRRYIENFDQQTMIDTARLVRYEPPSYL